MYIHVYIYIYTYVCVNACTSICMSIYIYIIYIYINMIPTARNRLIEHYSWNHHQDTLGQNYKQNNKKGCAANQQ